MVVDKVHDSNQRLPNLRIEALQNGFHFTLVHVGQATLPNPWMPAVECRQVMGSECSLVQAPCQCKDTLLGTLILSILPFGLSLTFPSMCIQGTLAAWNCRKGVTQDLISKLQLQNCIIVSATLCNKQGKAVILASRLVSQWWKLFWIFHKHSPCRSLKHGLILDVYSTLTKFLRKWKMTCNGYKYY